MLARFLFLFWASFLFSEVVNQPVANVFQEPIVDTQLETQEIYGKHVDVIERQGQWSKVTVKDGTVGWILSSLLSKNVAYEQSEIVEKTKHLFSHVYRTRNIKAAPPLVTLPYGSKIKVVQEEKRGYWTPVELVNGQRAWMQTEDIDFDSKLKILDEVIEFSKQFLGLPFTWAGTSSFGYDCSGFIQMLFHEVGIQLPRMVAQQVDSDCFYSVSVEGISKGDLLFFGREKITHVGLFLGNDEFIHSGLKETPIINISKLSNWRHLLILVRRIKHSL